MPTEAAEKLQHVNTNQLSNYNDGNKYDNKYNYNQYGQYDNDRYQAKLRKYKAYELLKQKQVQQSPVSRNLFITWSLPSSPLLSVLQDSFSVQTYFHALIGY